MITKFILMNGYGLYVWLNIIKIIIQLENYTKKTLKKYEREFLIELQALSSEEKNKTLKTSKVAQQILAINSKSI